MTNNAPNDDSKTTRPRKAPQKPVFIIQPFDATNQEHMKGNVTLVLNKRFATDLCKLISECQLDDDEGYFFAMKGHLQRWYKQRYDLIKTLRDVDQIVGSESFVQNLEQGVKDVAEGRVISQDDLKKDLGITFDEAHSILDSQIPDDIKKMQPIVRDVPPPNLR